jgi:hypothetical protein
MMLFHAAPGSRAGYEQMIESVGATALDAKKVIFILALWQLLPGSCLC